MAIVLRGPPSALKEHNDHCPENGPAPSGLARCALQSGEVHRRQARLPGQGDLGEAVAAAIAAADCQPAEAGLPLAGLLVFTVVAGAVWFERQQLDHPQRGPTISLRTAFVTAAVKAPVTDGAASERNEASSLRLTTTPVSSLEDNLPDALPATRTAPAPTQVESTGASTRRIPPRAGGNPRHHDKVHHVRRTKRAQDEPHRRYPTRNGFGYGWSPIRMVLGSMAGLANRCSGRTCQSLRLSYHHLDTITVAAIRQFRLSQS